MRIESGNINKLIGNDSRRVRTPAHPHPMGSGRMTAAGGEGGGREERGGEKKEAPPIRPLAESNPITR